MKIFHLILAAAIVTLAAGCDRQPTNKELVNRTLNANTRDHVRTYQEVLDAQKQDRSQNKTEGK